MPKTIASNRYHSSMRDNPFYIRFKTADKVLVQDRRSAAGMYYQSNGRVDEEFVNLVLRDDSRIKGVRVVSYTITPAGIDAIVAWLK